MKKIPSAFLALLLLLEVFTVRAQRKIDWAVKAGISIPNLSSGSADNPISSGYSSRLAFDGAIAVEWHLSPKFSLEPQLEYSQQGGQKNGLQPFATPADLAQQFPAGQAPQSLFANYNSTAKLNYLMLPVQVKYYFATGTHWRPYVEAGPFVSLLVSAHNVSTGSSLVYMDEKQTQPVTSTPISFNSSDNVKNDLHSWNTGISGQIGLQYKMRPGAAFLEAGGNYGLVDIQKDAANGTNKTGAAVIRAGFQFHF